MAEFVHRVDGVRRVCAGLLPLKNDSDEIVQSCDRLLGLCLGGIEGMFGTHLVHLCAKIMEAAGSKMAP